MRHTTRFVRASVVLACLLAAGCVTPATSVLVHVDSDLSLGGSLDVSVRVRGGDGGEPAVTSLSFGDGGRRDLRFPFSFGVTPRAGATADESLRLELDVLAVRADGSAIHFVREARFGFVSQQTTALYLFLAQRCGDRANGCRAGTASSDCTVSQLCVDRGLTCGDDGVCVDSIVVPRPLVDFDASTDRARLPDTGFDAADTPREAAFDAAVDAVRDTPVTVDASSDLPEACAPVCSGRVCGSDRCGGTCGASPCPVSMSCSDTGTCMDDRCLATRIALLRFQQSSSPQFYYGTGSPPAGYPAGVSVFRVWTAAGSELVQIYRCERASDGAIWVTQSPDCESSGAVPTAVGYVATSPVCGATLIYRLVRAFGADVVHYFTLSVAESTSMQSSGWTRESLTLYALP